jgi:prepilin-type N-terminal cleavage/methylation domain-containing protein
MNTTHGFSLTEVLISLLLLTTSSLALIRQEWHITQFFHQIYYRMDDLLQEENTLEVGFK